MLYGWKCEVCEMKKIKTATGGLAHEATTFYKCLASLLSVMSILLSWVGFVAV